MYSSRFRHLTIFLQFQAELPQAEEKASEFNVTASSTTTEKETTETTEPSDIVEEVVVVTPAGKTQISRQKYIPKFKKKSVELQQQ
jgi:hypothetical protein